MNLEAQTSVDDLVISILNKNKDFHFLQNRAVLLQFLFFHGWQFLPS